MHHGKAVFDGYGEEGMGAGGASPA
jgi:hypothetical protein